MAGQRSRHRMHCRECRRRGDTYRFTIRRAPKHYRRPVRCPRCRGTDLLDYEMIYRRAQDGRAKCFCNPVPHPHRTGSHRMCDAHPLRMVPLTEIEELQWRAVLENRRRTAFN